MNGVYANKKLNYLPLMRQRIRDPFWNRYMELVTREIIPYQYKALNDLLPDTPPSHSVRNFRIAAGLEEGDFDGHVFQDTDAAKWLEAVAYSLSYAPDPELEKTADELIRLIGMAQEENGYLNTYFSIRHPGRQFCNLKEGHELYTAGHMIEAAVAYYQITGKDEFLKIVCRCADNILQVFHSPEYAEGVPGHEEIELALVKLADVTGREDYRDMALEFVNRRGTTDYLSRENTLPRFVDCWYDRNPYIPAYGQAHKPVRQQDTAEGHAVRALYLYSAVADLAGHYQDPELLVACERLYDNITQKRMYITGGVGSSGILERFTTDYDLPNDTNYAESCASIALAMFCRRMARITGESKYMDTAELALMNTVLSGVSLDGKAFFYVNPLEVIPAACIPATDKNHVKPVRQKWFGCACCPPNIARTIASVGEYAFFEGERELWLNLFISGRYETAMGAVHVESGLPYQGTVSVTLEPAEAGALYVRIPDYAEEPRFTLNGTVIEPEIRKGYGVISVEPGENKLELSFGMPPRLIYADPRVSADSGKCAVKKGPMIYCLEECDNGANLAGLVIDNTKPLRELPEDTYYTITAQGFQLDQADFGGALYRTAPPKRIPAKLRFVPYCCWGNRKPGEMAVWVRYIL